MRHSKDVLHTARAQTNLSFRVSLESEAVVEAGTARGRILHRFEVQSGNGHKEDQRQGCGRRESILTQNVESVQRSVEKTQLMEAGWAALLEWGGGKSWISLYRGATQRGFII